MNLVARSAASVWSYGRRKKEKTLEASSGAALDSLDVAVSDKSLLRAIRRILLIRNSPLLAAKRPKRDCSVTDPGRSFKSLADIRTNELLTAVWS